LLPSFKTALIAAALCVTALPLTAQAESLRMSFDKSLQMTPLVAGATPSAGAQTTEQVVTLYPSAYSSRSGQTENLYDFEQKTFTVINHDKKTYTVYPLQSVAHFRSLDRIRRLNAKVGLYQQQAGGTALPIDTLLEDIDIDMMLAGIRSSKTTKRIQIKKEGISVTFTDGKTGAALASYEGKAGAEIPKSLQKSYAHFLTYEFTMHPVIKNALGAESGMIGKLVFTNRDMLRNLSAIYTWALKSSNITEENGPAMPEDYKRVYHIDPELDAAFKAAHTPYVFDANAYQQEVTSLIEQQKYLPLFLKYQQANLSMLPDMAAKNQQTFSATIKAAESFEKAAYLSIIQKPDNTAELRQYNDILEKAKKRADDMAWLLDYFIDDHTRTVLSAKKAPSKTDLQELAAAQTRLLLMLKKMPHNVSIYENTGDVHYSRLEVPTAMLYWAQAAEIAPQSAAARKFQQMKAQTETEFPEYF